VASVWEWLNCITCLREKHINLYKTKRETRDDHWSNARSLLVIGGSITWPLARSLSLFVSRLFLKDIQSSNLTDRSCPTSKQTKRHVESEREKITCNKIFPLETRLARWRQIELIDLKNTKNYRLVELFFRIHCKEVFIQYFLSLSDKDCWN